MLIKRPSFSATVTALSLVAAALWPLQAHALFDDDEARKAIIDLRNKFDAYRQNTEDKLGRLTQQAQEGNATGQRSLLELSNQNEQLRAEIARLRGQIEQLQRDVSDVQRQQKDMQSGVEQRLRQMEPARIELDGVEFSAMPDETRDFEAALALLRKADFGSAETAFGSLIQRYPSSGYLPSALYWLGNAQYANRAYALSIASHERLVRQYPDHLRSPEAMLAMANSQVELKDPKAAKLTLSNLVKTYPRAEASAAARDRLARLR